MINITIEMLYFSYGMIRYKIPNHMVEGLDSYINHRLKQGSFLHAVLCNDLMEAVKRADADNMAALPAYANFLHNYAPPECYGSVEEVEAWLKRGPVFKDEVKS